MIIPWMISPSAPAHSIDKDRPTQKLSWRQISKVTKLKQLWLIGLAIMAFSAGIQGLLGYLPIYLRGLGWQEIRADGAASFFHLASMLSVLPLTYLAGKIGKVKLLTTFALGLTTLSIGSLSLLQDRGIMPAIILAGLSRDSLMAMMITFAVNTKGVGAEYSGIALGFVFFLMGIGNMISPALGNKLADLSPSAPFLFWSALILVSVLCVLLSQKKHDQVQNS
jgi:cyanate permease